MWSQLPIVLLSEDGKPFLLFDEVRPTNKTKWLPERILWKEGRKNRIKKICFSSNGVKPDIGDDLESKIFLTSTVCNASHTPVCDSNGYIRPSKLYISRAYVDNLCPNKTTNLYGDFAVIELEKDLPFSETVQPACLNSTFFYSRGVWRRARCTIIRSPGPVKSRQ